MGIHHRLLTGIAEICYFHKAVLAVPIIGIKGICTILLCIARHPYGILNADGLFFVKFRPLHHFHAAQIIHFFHAHGVILVEPEGIRKDTHPKAAALGSLQRVHLNHRIGDVFRRVKGNIQHILPFIRAAQTAPLVFHQIILRPVFPHPALGRSQVFARQGGYAQLDFVILAVFQGVRGNAPDDFPVTEGPVPGRQPNRIAGADNLL